MPAKVILPSIPKESTTWKGFAKESPYWNQRNTLLWNMGNKCDSQTEETEACEGAANLDPAVIVVDWANTSCPANGKGLMKNQADE